MSRVTEEHVVAIGLLTERDLAVLGQGFRRMYRVEEGHDFGPLLAAIDAAERQLQPPMPVPRQPG